MYRDIYELSQKAQELADLYLDRVIAGEDGGNLLEVAAETEEELQRAILDRAKMVKNWQARLEALKAHKREIETSMRHLAGCIERAKETALEAMQRHAIDGPLRDVAIRISQRKSPDSVEVIEPLEIPEVLPTEVVVDLGDMKRIPIETETKTDLAMLRSLVEKGDPARYIRARVVLELDKGATKRAIQGGDAVPGVALITDKRHVVITAG